MNINKILILFFLQKVRLNKQGKCPIRCRITFNSQRKEFATGYFINPDNWDSKLQLAVPPEQDENSFINTQLSLIKSKINKAFLLLQVQEKEFNVEDIFNQFKGNKPTTDKTIIEAFNYHTERMSKLVGIDVVQVSVDKYYQTLTHVKSFLKHKYNKNDYLLKDLKMSFINDYEYYLKTELRFKEHTVYKSIQRFRRVVRVAVAVDYIHKDPFLLHKAKKPKKKVVYLTQEELKELENYSFSQLRLQEVADMFIFCCYTGLAYFEMVNLEDKHIIKGFDGNLWIRMDRQKTNREFSIPILPKAHIIINKYKDIERKEIFPKVSNHKFNSYLKEIAEIVGLEKNLTHHIARKTFASTVLLYNDVPMEIVSELLGHSKMSITQDHYGKIVQKKVSEEMSKLNKKLKP
jgi:integrase